VAEERLADAGLGEGVKQAEQDEEEDRDAYRTLAINGTLPSR
jgi:hypothetical protein